MNNDTSLNLSFNGTSNQLWNTIVDGHCHIYAFSILGICCLFLDILAFRAVKNRRGPPTNCSLFNLFIASSAAVVMPILKILRESKQLPIGGYWLCKVWGIYSRFSVAFLPMTMVGIFYEMTNAKKMAKNGLDKKVFVSVWLATFVLSNPGAATYKFTPHNETSSIQMDQCTKSQIMDSKAVHMIYDGIFLGSLSIFPSFYMIYGLCSLNFRLELLFLCQPIPLGLNKKVRRIRWVFFYAMFFILHWMFTGPIIFFMKLSGFSESKDILKKNRSFMIFGCLFLAHMALQPVFFLYAHNDIHLWRWFMECPLLKCVCYRALGRSRERPFQAEEISCTVMRMETYHLTSHCGNQNVHKV